MSTDNRDTIARILLIVLTVIIGLLQEYSLNKTLIIDANSAFKFKAVSDSSTQEGSSKASYQIVDNNIELNCTIIRENYAWPFCTLAFELYDYKVIRKRLGINFNSFNTVKIFAQYENIDPTGIRFNIRSFNPLHSTALDEESWKYNGIEYWLKNQSNPVEIPLKSLQVATWWLVENNIPISQSAADLKHSMLLEISTGNNIPEGQYKIILNRVEFHGKHFKTQTVYALIISLWLFAASTGVISHLTHSTRRAKAAEKKAYDLKKLNKLLNVETQSLKDQVERDPLTGALNRSGIQTVFISEIPIISIAFIDIDHFKLVNDNYGHAVGDEVLIDFAKVISENSRDTDFLARWGGEEFILVCPNTTLKSIKELSETLRILLAEHLWPQEIKLTASFGVAQKRKEEITTFIERADKALYAAKAQGRNQVVVAKNK